MSSTKKILFCYQYCNLGGVVSVLKQRAKFLLKDGYELYGYFQKDNGGKKDLIQSGFKEVIIDNEAKFKGLKELFRNNNFDNVTIIDFPVCVENLPNNKATLNYEVHTSLSRSIEGLNNIDISKISKFIVPSNWSKNWLADNIPKINIQNIEVIANIVDDEIFYPLPKSEQGINLDKILLLWVGKIVPDKNWIDAVRAFGKLKVKYPNAKFTFITGGQYTPQQTAEFIEELELNGITHNSQWLHNIDHSKMGEIYREASKCNSALVLTSLHESFSLVVHEGLKCGLTVIASNIDAIPEAIESGVNGYLYNPGDLIGLEKTIENILDKKSQNIFEFKEINSKLKSIDIHNLYLKAI